MNIPNTINSWFKDTNLSYSERIQGNSINKDSGMILGLRAGPQVHVSNLFHEMAHFIEIDDERCVMYGWGLEVPEVEVCGQICYEPNTYQASQREMIVVAIQMVLGEHFGRDSQWAYTLGSVCNFMPDSAYAPNFFNLPKELPYDILYKRGVIRCMKHYVMRQKRRFNINNIWEEWNRKCSIHDSFDWKE